MREYSIKRSNRKSISIEIKSGEVIVRAPLYMSDSAIRSFVSKHDEWIEKTVARTENEKIGYEPLTVQKYTVRELKEKANALLLQRVVEYAKKLGVEYNRISIKCQKTIWGSCSQKKNLNFNCLLALAPDYVIDGVICHELCHLIEMNHSKRFYSCLYSICPDYEKVNRWLKDNGRNLMKTIHFDQKKNG